MLRNEGLYYGAQETVIVLTLIYPLVNLAVDL